MQQKGRISYNNWKEKAKCKKGVKRDEEWKNYLTDEIAAVEGNNER